MNQSNSNLSKTRRENKERLITAIITDMRNNIYEYEDFIFDLVEETLNKRTQKELKQILHNE